MITRSRHKSPINFFGKDLNPKPFERARRLLACGGAGRHSANVAYVGALDLLPWASGDVPEPKPGSRLGILYTYRGMGFLIFKTKILFFLPRVMWAREPSTLALS